MKRIITASLGLILTGGTVLALAACNPQPPPQAALPNKPAPPSACDATALKPGMSQQQAGYSTEGCGN